MTLERVQSGPTESIAESPCAKATVRQKLPVIPARQQLRSIRRVGAVLPDLLFQLEQRRLYALATFEQTFDPRLVAADARNSQRRRHHGGDHSIEARETGAARYCPVASLNGVDLHHVQHLLERKGRIPCSNLVQWACRAAFRIDRDCGQVGAILGV